VPILTFNCTSQGWRHTDRPILVFIDAFFAIAKLGSKVFEMALPTVTATAKQSTPAIAAVAVMVNE